MNKLRILAIPRILKLHCRQISFLDIMPKKYDLGLGTYEIVKPGKVSQELPVPEHIKKPPYYYTYMPPCETAGKAGAKFRHEINGVKESGKIAANILQKTSKILEPGITTDEIDKFIHNEIIQANAYPSPLRYADFPKSVCTSVNNVVCHGIPDDRPLADGDIINIDITVYYNGYHGDCSKTFLIGNVDERGRHLVKITEECLYKGIEVCGPKVPFNAIGNAIEEHANKNGLNVVPAFIGHGIGANFHEAPQICHYKNKIKGEMQTHMLFTIEPILSLGKKSFKILSDEWTAVSTDGSRSAQFEHTILVTRDGCEILTLPDEI